MAKGDNAALIPGLASFLAEAKGEIKDIGSRMRELQKEIKKAGTASALQVQELSILERRQTALKYQLKNDSDLKRAAGDVKFLRSLALTQGVRSVLTGKMSPTDIAQIFLQPGVAEAMAQKLERAGKIGRFANTRLGAGLRAAGSALAAASAAVLPVAIVAEIASAAQAAVLAKMDEGEAQFVRRSETRQRRMALERRVELDEETLAAIRQEIEPLIIERFMPNVMGAAPGTPRSFKSQADTEAKMVKRLEEVARRVAQARGLGDFEVNRLTNGTQLAGLTGQESEKERDAILARLALSKVFADKLTARMAEEAAEKRRLEKHRREASPSTLYRENMQQQLDSANFAARRTVVRRPSWLPEVNYD